MPGETLGHSARCGHDISIHIAVILTCKRDLRPVGGEIGVQFPSRTGCQPFCLPTFTGNSPEVASVDEDDRALRNRGLLKKCGPVRVREPDECKKRKAESSN